MKSLRTIAVASLLTSATAFADESICEPGVEVFCKCPNSSTETGTKICAEDGMSFLDCSPCSGAGGGDATGAGGGSGTSSSAGSGGYTGTSSASSGGGDVGTSSATGSGGGIEGTSSATGSGGGDAAPNNSSSGASGCSIANAANTTPWSGSFFAMALVGALVRRRR